VGRLLSALRSSLASLGWLLDYTVVKYLVPVVGAVAALVVLGLSISLLAPLVRPFGVTEQQLAIVNGGVLILLVFAVPTWYILRTPTDDDTTNPPDRAGPNDPVAVDRRSGDSTVTSLLRALTGPVLKLFLLLAGMAVALVGLNAVPAVLASGGGGPIPTLAGGVLSVLVALVVLWLLTPVVLNAQRVDKPGEDSGVSGLLSHLTGLLVVPASFLVFLSRRPWSAGASGDELTDTVVAMRESLEAVADHRHRLKYGAKPPESDTTVGAELDALVSEWESVASHADRLVILAEGMDVANSPADIDGLRGEWANLREVWTALQCSERAPLQPGQDWGSVASAAATVRHRAERHAQWRETDRDRLESDPEQVFAAIRDDDRSGPDVEIPDSIATQPTDPCRRSEG